mmetsp:Transcript_42059/g.82282  ORF Transcript_42059/g.82282 Transcript_42059/m.82282 type:complete len:88 (-) Transcript_42059:92-355(-)
MKTRQTDHGVRGSKGAKSKGSFQNLFPDIFGLYHVTMYHILLCFSSSFLFLFCKNVLDRRKDITLCNWLEGLKRVSKSPFARGKGRF